MQTKLQSKISIRRLDSDPAFAVVSFVPFTPLLFVSLGHLSNSPVITVILLGPNGIRTPALIQSRLLVNNYEIARRPTTTVLLSATYKRERDNNEISTSRVHDQSIITESVTGRMSFWSWAHWVAVRVETHTLGATAIARFFNETRNALVTIFTSSSDRARAKCNPAVEQLRAH